VSTIIAGAAGQVTVMVQARSATFAAALRQLASAGRSVAGSDRASHGAAGSAGAAHRALMRMPWPNALPASSTSALQGDVASTHGAERRAAHPVASTRDGGGLPVPSPFGPPGRDTVGVSGGVSGSTAGSGVVCAILVCLLLLSFQPSRRFRLLPVAVGPTGFTSLQQRPG
jgi:hypothetical protein